jgi:hypothetical protein
MLYLDNIKLGWVKNKKQKGGHRAKEPESITNVPVAPYMVGLERASITLGLDVDDYSSLAKQLYDYTRLGTRKSFCLYDTEYPIWGLARSLWVRAPALDTSSSLLEMGQVAITAYPAATHADNPFVPPVLPPVAPEAGYSAPGDDTTMLYVNSSLMGEVGDKRNSWARQLVDEAMPVLATDVDFQLEPATGPSDHPKIKMKLGLPWYAEAVDALHQLLYASNLTQFTLATSAYPIFNDQYTVDVVGLAYDASCDKLNTGTMNISGVII